MGETANKIGNYQVLEKIGAGTVGTVYKAKQVTMERMVALKVLNPQYAKDAQFVQRFIEEARTAGRVNQANVCQVYEVGHDRGLHFFSMELVEGLSLEASFRQTGKLTPEVALDYMHQAALALKAAHLNGLVHRDVKPANLLLSENNVVKLVDLGLARDTNKPVQQMELGLAGTPYYMAPEQGQGLEVDIRSDIYALGATFYHLMTGNPPFTGPHSTAVMMKHAAEPLVPLNSVDSNIPKRVSSLIEKMMAKSPDDRFASPAALITEIERVQSGKGGMPAMPAPRRRLATKSSSRTVRPKSTTPPFLVPAVVGGGALLVLGILAVLLAGGEDPAITRADEALSEASKLAGSSKLEPLKHCSHTLLKVMRGLPRSEEGDLRRNRAESLHEQVEDRIFDLNKTEISQLMSAAEAGRVKSGQITKKLDKIQPRYSSPDMPRHISTRALKYFRNARELVAAIAESEAAKEMAKAKPEKPKPDAAMLAAAKEIRNLLNGSEFAEALELADALLAASQGSDETRLIRNLRAEIAATAGESFQALTKRVSLLADAGRYPDAKAALVEAKKQYAFPPYAEKLETALSRLEPFLGQTAPPPVTVTKVDADPDKAVTTVIESVALLLERNEKAAAKKLLEELKKKHRWSKAYRGRRDEIEILEEIVGM